MKFKSDIRGVIEEKLARGMLPHYQQTDLDLQPEECSEGDLIGINEESGFDKKDDVPELVLLAKNCHVKRLK